MRFRTSISSFQVTLLAAMGFGSVQACSGNVVNRTESPGDGGADSGGQSTADGGASAGGGSGGASSGGAAMGGGPSGGSSSGGRASGGAPTGGSGGTSTGGRSIGGATTGGAPTGGTGGKGGSGGVVAAACESPMPITGTGTGTGPTGGYVRCADGKIHRTKVEECWSSIDPDGAPVVSPTWPAGSVTYGCHKNADCTASPHGYCEVTAPNGGFGGAPSVSCIYGCVKDSECGQGRICMCGDPVGRCVDASCASDEDCSAGIPCQMGNIVGVCGPTINRFKCGPLCTKNTECPQDGFGYTCIQGDCRPGAACGRPFLVGREARLGDIELRKDWGSTLSPDVGSLPADVRRALAEHYAAVGLMEHASVAAFARFSLELLALGAPAELVRLSGAAMGDEIEHAKLCFGLAAAYGDRSVGPGPLEVSGALDDAPLAEKLRIAFVEACLGETCAAIEAAEAAERATDPVVAAVLRRISADETRHAELGWRFAKWALDQMDPATRSVVLSDLHALVERERDAANAPATSGSEPDLLVGHGVLPAVLRSALRSATIRDAVLPCLQSLSQGVRVLPDRASRRGLVSTCFG